MKNITINVIMNLKENSHTLSVFTSIMTSTVKDHLKQAIFMLLIFGFGHPVFGQPVSFEVADKWGLKDQNGTVILNPKYGSIYEFSEGLAKVTKPQDPDEEYIHDYFGYIDEKGKEVIPLIFYSAENFNRGLALVSKFISGNEFYGFIDKSGKEVVNLKYNDAKRFEEGMAAIAILDKNNVKLWGFINIMGKEVIKPQYDDVDYFNNEMARVTFRIGEKYDDIYCGFINKSGVLVTTKRYTCYYSFSEGLAAVGINIGGHCNYHYIDKKGKTVIDSKYDEADNFLNGLAVVGIGNDTKGYKYGIIDKTGKVILPLLYDRITQLEQGKSEVTLNEKTFFVDKQGKIIE